MMLGAMSCNHCMCQDMNIIIIIVIIVVMPNGIHFYHRHLGIKSSYSVVRLGVTASASGAII